MHKESQDGGNGIKLTPRGREVFRFIRKGWSDRRIAEHLGISYSGVRRHRKKMLLANGCDTMLEQVARYYATRKRPLTDKGVLMEAEARTVIISTPEELLPLITEAVRIAQSERTSPSYGSAPQNKKLLAPKDIEQEFGRERTLLETDEFSLPKNRRDAAPFKHVARKILASGQQ